MQERYAHAVYCDDLRAETSGKTTFVGVYGDSLLIGELPATLPRLCLRLYLVTPLSRPFKHLTIQISLNENILAEPKLSETEIEQPPSQGLEGDQDPWHNMIFDFVFSPLVLSEPGEIKIKVTTEEGELKAMPLKILKQEIS